MFLVMTNRFGLDLPPDRVRWAAAERVSEDVIATVLLLHERSVEEIVPQLSPLELERAPAFWRIRGYCRVKASAMESPD